MLVYKYVKIAKIWQPHISLMYAPFIKQQEADICLYDAHSQQGSAQCVRQYIYNQYKYTCTSLRD